MRTNNGIPIPPGLAKYATIIAGASEWTDKVLWDTQQYAAAGQVFLDFFQGLPASLPAGNLTQAGTIGNNVMIVRSVGVFVRSTVTGGTVGLACEVISKQGVFRITIGAKEYGIWPIDLVPVGGGVAGWAMDNTGLMPYDTSNLGVPHPSASYNLTRPLLIPPNLNFRVRLEWTAAIAVTAATNLVVCLKGEMGRFVQ
jgi:hypothetical protein